MASGAPPRRSNSAAVAATCATRAGSAIASASAQRSPPLPFHDS